MTAPPPSPRRRYFTRWIVGATLLLCFVAFYIWFTWNPFERIYEPQPLAVIQGGGLYPHAHHAEGRDELVFLRDDVLEIHRIDAKLTRLRVRPITGAGSVQFHHVIAFPTSARALLNSREGVFVVDTESGLIEQKTTLPDTAGQVIISPDERWIAAPPLVVDLRTNDVIKLIGFEQLPGSPVAMKFVSPNSLVVARYSPATIELWDISTRQRLWTVTQASGPYLSAMTVSGSRLLVGQYDSCTLWNIETQQLIRTHSASRTTSAVAMNPQTGDYLAGYSRGNFRVRRGLGGTVRIWNADGERLRTFAAHRDGEWPNVTWMAFSTNGEYLVTAIDHNIKVWDYAVVSGR